MRILKKIKMNEINFFRKLQDIMIMEDFMDITIVCDDKTEFRAHRNILSAFSPVMRQMLQSNAKSSHPVVFLRGVKKQELESILKFIYLGEVSFNQSRMKEFLAVADILEVNELRETIGAHQTLENDEKKINLDNFSVVQDSFCGDIQDSKHKSPNELGKTSRKAPLMYRGVPLFPPDKRKCTSLSWEHGGFVKMPDGNLDKSHLICCHCGAQLRYNGTPSILSNHVERRHNAEWVATLCKGSQSSKRVEDVEELGESLEAPQDIKNVEKSIDFEGFAFAQDSYSDQQISSREPSQSFGDFSVNQNNPQAPNKSKASVKDPVMYKGVQLFPPDITKRTISPSWEHGGFAKREDGSLNKSHVICRHCGANLKYCGSPSVLAHHVERLHNTSLSKDSQSSKNDLFSAAGTNITIWTQS